MLAMPAFWSAPAAAQVPQELEQLEPGRGEGQIEYQGLFESLAAAGSSHSVGVSYGLSERLALGVEIEGERESGRFELENLSVFALHRLTPAGAGPVALGIKMSVGFDTGGHINEAEFRLIAERIGSGWWLQANLMAQGEAEHGQRSASVAFAANASREVMTDVWVGIEASGDLFRLAGSGPFANGQFIGPAASIEVGLGEDRELELGLVHSIRIAGQGPANSLRMFAQLGF